MEDAVSCFLNNKRCGINRPTDLSLLFLFGSGVNFELGNPSSDKLRGFVRVICLLALALFKDGIGGHCGGWRRSRSGILHGSMVVVGVMMMVVVAIS